MTDEALDLQALARATHEQLVRQARLDSAVFVGELFGYEMAPFQRRWHDALRHHDELVIWAPVEHGKTQQLSIGHPIWLLGTDPSRAGMIVSDTSTQAEKSLGAARRLIDESAFCHEVFPALEPMGGSYAKWTDQAIRVKGAPVGGKDYSLAACGVGGPILGARLDFAILDDVLDFENTRTLNQRKKTIDWVDSTLLGRMKDGAQILVVGNAWFADDLMFVLEKRGFHSIREPAFAWRGDHTIEPDSILWPAQWPLERLAKRAQLFGEIETERQLRCEPYRAGRGNFKLEWFEWAFGRGEGLSFEPVYRGPWPTYCGVDLGVQETSTADETVFWVIAADPATGDRRVLWVEGGRMEGPTILEHLRDLYTRYGCVFMVENVAAQAYLEQFARDAGIPVEGFTTGKQKADPRFGIPSLAVELESRKWILPSHELCYRWRSECLAYQPGAKTGDYLMASWFAREAARSLTGLVDGITVEPSTRTGVDYGRLRARYGSSGRRARLFRAE